MGQEEFKSSWDEECKEKKKKVRNKLRKWRKGKSSGGEYNKKKNEYYKVCEKRKEEDNKRFEEEAEKPSPDAEILKIVNRERKRTKRINQDIDIVKWKSTLWSY